MLIVDSRILRFTAQFALTGYLFYLVNEYVLGYEEEEDEPGAETTAPSIAVASKPLQQGVEGTKAPEAEQVEELLVQLPDKLPEDAIFIPLWWGKKRPLTYYKKSDPEWQGYVKFAHDKKRVKAIKGALNSFCRYSRRLMLYPGALAMQIVEISKNPHWTRFLGAPVQLDRVWLDIDYPLGPPPEYDRPGYACY